MARIYGLSGRITGRKGDAVFAVRGGEQIVRQYNPIVRNPQTEAQTKQRAKMKLMSQVGAILAPVLAIPSQGAKSGRNILTEKCIQFVEFEPLTGDAKVHLDKLMLTDSARPISQVAFGPGDDDEPTAYLQGDETANFDKVVYVVLKNENDGDISIVAQQVCSTPGADGQFTTVFPGLGNVIQGKSYCVYAYGMKTNDGAARARIDSIVGDSANNAAKLATSRTNLASNVLLSRTTAAVGTFTAH